MSIWFREFTLEEIRRIERGTIVEHASVALAETLGSIGGSMCVDRERFQIVGQEINANHLRPALGGHVTGRAKPVHIGRRSQVWNIEITDDNQRLICVSRLTIAVIERQLR